MKKKKSKFEQLSLENYYFFVGLYLKISAGSSDHEEMILGKWKLNQWEEENRLIIKSKMPRQSISAKNRKSCTVTHLK